MQQPHPTMVNSSLSHHPLITCWAVLAILLLSVGCSAPKRGPQPTTQQPIPLTPAMWLSPSVTTAEVPYHNACGKKVSYPLNRPITESVPKKLASIFADITVPSQPDDTLASDGAIEVGLGVRRIDLALPKQVQGIYPAAATVGIELVFLARDGTLLFSKKVEGVGRGMVEVRNESCEVTGLDTIVQSAVDAAAETLAEQIGQSGPIREYAAQRDTRVTTAPRARSTATELATGLVTPSPIVSEKAPVQAQAALIASTQPVLLSFRAILRDENRNQFLDPDEALTIEIEVKNEGSVEAKDVLVAVEGQAELAALFSSEVPVGTLQPGEIRRTSITRRVTGSEEALHGELILTLRTASPMSVPPPPKTFSLKMRPKHLDGVVVADVDQLPKSLSVFNQSKAVIIAIGVGTFRDDQVPAVKNAGYDAQVMAEYLRTIANVPGERIRVLLGRKALEQDFVDTFEQWLRKRADRETVVYVFFAGRAIVDGGTGAISLVPYDGALSGTGRLYPLRRLQEALNRLPIQRAILMFDVSMDPSPGTDLAAIPSPAW